MRLSALRNAEGWQLYHDNNCRDALLCVYLLQELLSKEKQKLTKKYFRFMSTPILTPLVTDKLVAEITEASNEKLPPFTIGIEEEFQVRS